jgi:hypothetical protein
MKNNLFNTQDENVKFELNNGIQTFSKKENNITTAISFIDSETIVSFEKHKTNEVNKYFFLIKTNLAHSDNLEDINIKEHLQNQDILEAVVVSNRDTTSNFSNKHSILERNYEKNTPTNKANKLIDFVFNRLNDTTIDKEYINDSRLKIKF